MREKIEEFGFAQNDIRFVLNECATAAVSM
jgi:hypothetical protein